MPLRLNAAHLLEFDCVKCSFEIFLLAMGEVLLVLGGGTCKFRAANSATRLKATLG